MTIGFFGTDIALLASFKETVQSFPQHDYAAYIDTEDVGADIIGRGVEWLAAKKTDVIFVGDTDLLNAIRLFQTTLPVMLITESAEYLERNVQTKEGEGTVRSVHITKHSDAQDQEMAEILGGYFIAE